MIAVVEALRCAQIDAIREEAGVVRKMSREVEGFIPNVRSVTQLLHSLVNRGFEAPTRQYHMTLFGMEIGRGTDLSLLVTTLAGPVTLESEGFGSEVDLHLQQQNVTDGL